MKFNRLGLMSLLSLLGILGLVMDNSGFLGFFGFAYYIRYFFVTPDELFQQNVRQAASIGFFSGVCGTGVALVLRVLFPAFISVNIALAVTYVLSMFSFTIALVVLEIREQRGMM